MSSGSADGLPTTGQGTTNGTSGEGGGGGGGGSLPGLSYDVNTDSLVASKAFLFTEAVTMTSTLSASAVTQALSQSSAAQTAAQAAQTDATDAQIVADQALANAVGALSAAQMAQTTANGAQSSAQAAQMAADAVASKVVNIGAPPLTAENITHARGRWGFFDTSEAAEILAIDPNGIGTPNVVISAPNRTVACGAVAATQVTTQGLNALTVEAGELEAGITTLSSLAVLRGDGSKAVDLNPTTGVFSVTEEITLAEGARVTGPLLASGGFTCSSLTAEFTQGALFGGNISVAGRTTTLELTVNQTLTLGPSGQLVGLRATMGGDIDAEDTYRITNLPAALDAGDAVVLSQLQAETTARTAADTAQTAALAAETAAREDADSILTADVAELQDHTLRARSWYVNHGENTLQEILAALPLGSTSHTVFMTAGSYSATGSAIVFDGHTNVTVNAPFCAPDASNALVYDDLSITGATTTRIRLNCILWYGAVSLTAPTGRLIFDRCSFQQTPQITTLGNFCYFYDCHFMAGLNLAANFPGVVYFVRCVFYQQPTFSQVSPLQVQAADCVWATGYPANATLGGNQVLLTNGALRVSANEIFQGGSQVESFPGWPGTAADYVKGDGATGDFGDDVDARATAVVEATAILQDAGAAQTVADALTVQGALAAESLSVGGGNATVSQAGAIAADSVAAVGALTGASATTTGAVTCSALACTGTGALTVPVGTEAQRPTPAAGLLRYNSTTNTFEGAAGSSPAWGPIGGGGGGGPEWSAEQLTYTAQGLLQAPPQQISAASITGTPTRLYCQCLTNSYAIFTDAGASAFVWVCNKDPNTGTWTFGERVAVDHINNVVRAAGNKVIVLSNNGAGSGTVKEYTYSAGTIAFTRSILSGGLILMDLSPDGLYVLVVNWSGSLSQPYLYFWNGASWVGATGNAFTTETYNLGPASSVCLMLDGIVNRFAICDRSWTVNPLRIKMYDVALGSTPVINTTAAQTLTFTNDTPIGWTWTNAQLLYDTTNVAYQYLHLVVGGDAYGRMRSYEWSGGTFTPRLDTVLGVTANDWVGWNNNTAGNLGNRPAAIFQDKLVAVGWNNVIRQYSLVKTSGSPFLAVTYESEISPAGGTFGATASIALSPDGTSLGYYKDNSSTPEYLEFFARAPNGSLSVTYQETADNLEAAGILRLTGPYLKLPVTPAGTIQSLVPAVDNGLMFLDSTTGTLRYLWGDAWQVLAFGTSTGGTLLSGYVPGSGNLSIGGQLLQCTQIYRTLDSGVPLVELQDERLTVGLDLSTPGSPTISSLSTGRFTAASWTFAVSRIGAGTSAERYRVRATPTGNAQAAASAVLTVLGGVQMATGYTGPKSVVFYSNGQESSNPMVEVQIFDAAGAVASGDRWILTLLCQWSLNS